MATEYVRVRMHNGTHKSISKSHAERLGLQQLKQDAVGRDGRPLPPKHRVDLGTASAAKSWPYCRHRSIFRPPAPRYGFHSESIPRTRPAIGPAAWPSAARDEL